MTNLKDSQILNHKHNLEWNWLLIATILKVGLHSTSHNLNSSVAEGLIMLLCDLSESFGTHNATMLQTVFNCAAYATRGPYTKCPLEGYLSTNQFAKLLWMNHQKKTLLFQTKKINKKFNNNW